MATDSGTAATNSGTAATNVAMMRHFVTEVQQNGNFDLIDEMCHPDFFDHTAQPGQSPHRDGVHWVMRFIKSSISELKIEIVHCISDGRVIATTKIFRGIQVADIFGKPPTNKPIEFRIMDFLVVQDGLLKDHWATLSPIQDV